MRAGLRKASYMLLCMSEKNLISLARGLAGLTQTQLARDVGISQPHLSAIENGHKEPLVSTAIRIAQRLRQPVPALFSDADPNADATFRDFYNRHHESGG